MLELQKLLSLSLHLLHSSSLQGEESEITLLSQEVMALVQHHAERARQEHPMQRLMPTPTHDGETTLATTDMHLAHGLGEALHRAFKGDLSARYERGQTLMRVHWTRRV